MARVTMYATHSCPSCQRARDVLTTERIGPDCVRVVFVDDYPDALAEFRSQGFTAVPAFEAGADHWQGFDLMRLRRALHVDS